MEEEFAKEDSDSGGEEREINRQYYQRELRSLELIAYAELLSAIRASGALDEGKKNIINFVREAFHIPEERHKAEIRRVTSDERLGLIADMINGRSTSQGWEAEGFAHFPTLPHIVKYVKDQPPDELESEYDRVNDKVKFEDADESEIPKGFLDQWIREGSFKQRYYAEKPLGDDFTEFSIKSESESSTSQSSESSSESEDELPAIRTIRRRGPLKRKIVAVKPKVLPGRGNVSPDITDTPISPMKREINRIPARRGRGAKSQLSSGGRMASIIVSKNINKPSMRGKSVKKFSNPKPVERTSSGETPDEDIPIKRTKPSEDELITKPVSQVIRGGGRGRGLGRIRGGRGLGLGRGAPGRGGGRGRGVKRDNHRGNPEKASIVAAKLKIKLTRPLKSKIKKPVIPSPVGSRRKSKLKEKPIDDLIVEMRNYDDHVGRSFSQTEMSTKRINRNEDDEDTHSPDKIESDIDSALLKENVKSKDESVENEISTNSASKDKDIRDVLDNSTGETEPKDDNHEDRLNENDKDSSSSKSDSENSCSSFSKNGSRPGSPPVSHQLAVSSAPFSEVVISSSGSGSNSNRSSSSSSSIDDNEENENSSDADIPEVAKTNVTNSQNQSSNSPIPLQSINSQQCNTPNREMPSPPLIQKPIRHKISAGVNPSPGVIIQQPRNPLPAPVFSTSLNMSNFHKKRTKLLANSVADGYNLHLPPGNSASGVTTTVATASSLATRRPTIISTAGVGGIYSNSTLPPSGRTPGILHQPRKAHPHILSTSKAHRNFIPNSNSNTNSLNTNNISLSTQSQSITVTSVSTNCISTVTNSVQVQPNQHFTSTTSTTISAISSLQQAPNTTPVSAQNFQTQSGSALSMANAIPIGSVGVARTQGTNIIFLQKTSSSNTTGNTSALSSNVLPVKNSPRAVILRRAQIPRQGGNVMILDVQKNQLVNANQVPQFLQNARILSAPPELSMLNLPGNQPTRKIIQAPSSVSPSPSSAMAITYPAASSIGLESPFRQPGIQTQLNVQAPTVRKARIISQPTVVVTSTASQIALPPNPTALRTALTGRISNTAVVAPSSSVPNCLSSSGTAHIVLPRKETMLKVQPTVDGLVSLNSFKSKINSNSQCPIEAELMEMERNEIYEEEVVTSEIDSSSNSSSVSGFPKLSIPSAYQLSNSSKIEDTINCQHIENSKLDTSIRLSNSASNVPVSRSSNNEGSSTDTASENESSFTSLFPSAESQKAKQKPIVEVSNVYSSNSTPLLLSSVSINSKSVSDSAKSDSLIVPPHINEESIQSTPITEDIFEAALKSSGIIFNDTNPFFDHEDDLSTNSYLADINSSQDLEVASQVEVITIADNAE